MQLQVDSIRLSFSSEQQAFLNAIILSKSNKETDLLASFVAQVGQKQADDFASILEACTQKGWLRVSHYRDSRFVYLTPDGMCVAFLAFDQGWRFNSTREFHTLVKGPEAHYARFFAWLTGQHLWGVNDECLEQSVNDCLHTMLQSDRLWYLPLSHQHARDAGDYFLATYPGLMQTLNAGGFEHLRHSLSGAVKKALPVDMTKDAALFSANARHASLFLEPLNEQYLVKRESELQMSSRMRPSFSHLIDLCILQCLRPELVNERIAQLNTSWVRTSCLTGFQYWEKTFSKLTASDNDLVLQFSDAGAWLETVVNPDGLAWGQCVLDLLQLCRVKTRPDMAVFLSDLGKHSLSTALDAQVMPATFNLARMAQQLFAYLTDKESAKHYIEKPDLWKLWITEVSAALSDSSETQSERLVWEVSRYDTVTIRIQKKGQRGWSRGRKVSANAVQYDHSIQLSSIDLAIAEYMLHRPDYWRDEASLTPILLNMLSQSDSVVDENGQPISLVPEKVVVIFEEKGGCLAVTPYPQRDAQSSLLTPTVEGIFTFRVIPQSLERFMALTRSMPSVPLDAADTLINQISDHVQWYFPAQGRGNITLSQWDPMPHVWLKLSNGLLELSIEHQSVDARMRIPSGYGSAYLYQSEGSWYQRDLAKEQQQAANVCTQLALGDNERQRYTISQVEMPALLAKLEQLDDVTLHWHPLSKRVSQLNVNDVGLTVRQQGDWFQVSAEVRIDGEEVLDLKRLLEMRRSGYITLEKNNLTIMVSDALRQQLHFLDSVLDDNQSVNRQLAYPLQKLVETMSVQSDEGWRALEAAWSKPVDIDEKHMAPLRDYQRSGVQWAAHLLDNGFGACLADDMGLGKTLQALTLINHYHEQGPSLVVCPKSVLMNWRQESERFTPKLTVVDLEGCKDRRKALADTAAGEIVIVSYGLVTRLAETLREINWQVVVLDEAQQIKNPNAERAKAVFSLTAERRIALSGTPVENHLVELWSQFAFLNPGLLGSLRQFKAKYGKANKDEQDLRRLRALVGPFILRRLKEDVLVELPEKTELVHHVELTGKERSAYEAVRKDALEGLNTGGSSAISLFAGLTRMRQVCCDAGLVFEHLSDVSSKQKEALSLVTDALDGGHKILVFSQFVQLLKRFGQRLTEKKIGYSYLDGQSSSQQRNKAIEAFKSGEQSVFLISLKAGGAGLNLTEADTVIHLDPWWNPAVEDQASDRAYRMGQTKPVTVYRLVASNTVEEKIIQLHTEKRDLADKVLSGQSDAEKLKPELLLQLMTE